MADLDFEAIEDAFPEGAQVHDDGRITVNAAWLHQFAANLAQAARTPVNAKAKLGGPSTLPQQVKQAQEEWDNWTPEKRASVRLEGNSGLRPIGEREKP